MLSNCNCVHFLFHFKYRIEVIQGMRRRVEKVVETEKGTHTHTHTGRGETETERQGQRQRDRDMETQRDTEKKRLFSISWEVFLSVLGTRAMGLHPANFTSPECL